MRSRPRVVLGLLFAALALVLVVAGPASAASKSKTPKRTSSKLKLSTKTTVTTNKDGTQHYHFVYGPVKIQPGQNSIFVENNKAKPKVPGYILSFAPNLIEQDGTIPRVDQIHLHHAVWLVGYRPQWAAGEEKTSAILPSGYGWPYKPSDVWRMNHMIHDLTPNPDVVYITYDMNFLPASSPKAAAMRPVRTQWMDVEGGKTYPVFDAIKGTGVGPKSHKRFTFPNDAANPYPGGRVLNTWVVTRPETLVQTAGHLHPGGLHTDLKVTRNGRTKLLFRSDAKYWEPAGAVSWDVSMTATPKSWRVAVKPGDVVTVSATYDTTKASWYESMGIMPLAVADGGFGVDPFSGKIETRGKITHGPLAENRNHGGAATGLLNPLSLPNGPVSDGKVVDIFNFIYAQGNFGVSGQAGRPPVVHPGQSLTFLNKDAPQGLTGSFFDENSKVPVYHTITACKAPCTKSTGIAYPLANGNVTFDSGELGYGPAGATAAAQRNTWETPKNLKPGTYTYFCRIHPYMRGSFRVVRLNG